MEKKRVQDAPTIQELVVQAREIAETVVSEEMWGADSRGVWVVESMEALKSERLTALMVPEESGGMGHSLYALVRVS